ncbi:DNA phosphorothioation-associated putative methyltransferase [Roseofilum sp. BLCC_M154]|uniref:DNA phosphorothioation-associated putative methyltransferase n=1 Tax=Roseofilum acuticapitatum BLCC-M154 TaxID=3022444 RepID=A0ABT7AMD0_9CYAN|nr:DNA phosphorothioation-associated putative methyltransferase [Roseofilum acuticapitatum]MDJ1168035.1 DNA phosphorothioation-associated putative methyltransferase [Roseofilum acuticapitatum BLCC-M154]
MVSHADILSLCQQSAIGKHLPNALYVHLTALDALDAQLQEYETLGRQIAGEIEPPTLIKFHLDQAKISYLYYPDFDHDPHPSLHASLQVDLTEEKAVYRDYRNSENPPILHRKETFVMPDYPQYEKFAQLTRQEEEWGLLNKRSGFSIGTLKHWQKWLSVHRVNIEDHRVVAMEHTVNTTYAPVIERYKAAMVRKELSRPVRLALEAELFTPETTFFDYGCGYGEDIKQVARKGYTSGGWDPYYRPDTPLHEADVVNLGYVINVIEDQGERREALIKAWELTQKVLVVSAQVLISAASDRLMAYADGVITQRNTFQKYYEQEELKTYIDQVLEVDAVPVDLGIYFVFRDRTQAEIFRASRFHSRLSTPRIRIEVRRFEDYQELLAPLMVFFTDRGRLPKRGELAEETPILEEFGTFRRAFKLVLQVTEEEEWEKIATSRRQDFLVYLALSHFSDRPQFRHLSPLIRQDIQSLFGSYKSACILADQMLFSLGDLDFIARCSQNSPVGKFTPKSFTVHAHYLDSLDPRLRLYEGCANRTIGRLEGATLIKFHLNLPKISYLFYPDFDTNPHPLLKTILQIDLRDLAVYYENYDDHPNPPILHRKEQFIDCTYPQFTQFEKLSLQEEKWGLFEDWQAIQTRRRWLKCLEEHGVEISGSKVRWRKDLDPYRLKLLKSAHKKRLAAYRKSVSDV